MNIFLDLLGIVEKKPTAYQPKPVFFFFGGGKVTHGIGSPSGACGILFDYIQIYAYIVDI